MKIEIGISADRKQYTIAVDGGPTVPLESFMLLTKEGEQTRNLVFGSAENIGRLLYGLYVNCWKFEENGMRDVIETVAGDIREGRELREQASEETLRRLM